MGTPETIKIGEVEYVRKDSAQPDCKGDVKIVILQRGWIMVGKFERSGNDCKLNKASVIRNWGTTKGLGEIAVGGPTESTKLDKCGGVVSFDYLTVVASIDCSEESWRKHL
jgi:hypothetical protein